MSDEFHIEQVIDRRGSRNRGYEYHIKWDGYSSDDNTWEERENLVTDGFEQQVDDYDASLKRSKKKDRSRSKTPERKRTPAKKIKPVTPPPKEEEDTVQSESSDRETSDDTAQTAVYEDGVPSISGPLFLAFLFVLSIFAHVVANSLLTVIGSNEESKKYVEYFNVGNDPLPILVCVYTMYKYGSQTDFTNRAIALVSWLAMAKLCMALSPFHDANKKTNSVVFSLLMWQFLTILALYSPPVKSKTSSIVSFLAFALTATSFVYHYFTFEGYRLSVEHYLVVFVSLCAFLRALVVTAFSGDFPMSTVVEFCGATVGSVYTIIYVLNLSPTYSEFLPKKAESHFVVAIPNFVGTGTSTGSIDLNIFEFTQNLMIWTGAISFMCAAVLYQK